MKDFLIYKENALREFKKAKENNLIDKPILSLLEKINNSFNYYTTSSCSGRITIDIFYGEKKRDHIWLFKKHDLFSFEEFFNVLLKIKELNQKFFLEEVYLRFDNFIIHIGAKTLEDAEKLLKIAKELGLKRSGVVQIKPRILLEILGLDHLNFPLVYNGKLLINLEEDKVKELFNLVVKKMIKNWERLKKFEDSIDQII